MEANENVFLQKLCNILEIYEVNSQNNDNDVNKKKKNREKTDYNVFVYNEFKKMSIHALNLKCNEALNEARRLSRNSGTARPIFHAILNEYERWLYSTPSEYENVIKDFKVIKPRENKINSNHSSNSMFSMLPPSIQRRCRRRNISNNKSRHNRLVKKVERKQKVLHQEQRPSTSCKESVIPKEDYIILNHAVAPEDNDKYPAVYNPTTNMFEQLVFPAKHPYGKRDSEYLKEWLDSKINNHDDGAIDTIEKELSNTIPTVNIAISEIIRQFHPNDREEINFVVSLWQMVLKVMSIMMLHINKSKEDHAIAMEKSRKEHLRLDKLIESVTQELKDAVECTNNLKSDTNILERALKSKEQKLDHLVMKHHNTAKHLRKVLKLVQKMEDEEFLNAYKEGERIERIDGLPHVMDRLSDVLMEHEVEIEETRERIRLNNEDFNDENELLDDNLNDKLVMRNSKFGELEDENDDYDSADEEFGELDEPSSLSLNGEQSSSSGDFNGVTNDDIEITKDVHENLAILNAELSFLRQSLKEKLPVNIYLSTCHRETQTDQLDLISVEKNLPNDKGNEKDKKIHHKHNSGNRKSMGKKGKKQKEIYVPVLKDKVPSAMHSYITFLPSNFSPKELSFKVTHMHIDRIYNEYIKHFEKNNKPIANIDNNNIGAVSHILMQFAYDLYLGIEEIVHLAQSRLCIFFMSVIKHSKTDMGCHMFARLCHLLPNVSLPNESINVYFAALSHLKNHWRCIRGDKYIKLDKAQETVGLLCNTSLHTTNVGLKNLSVLIGIDGGLDRVQYLTFDTFMQYVITMWEKDYKNRREAINRHFEKNFNIETVKSISNKDFFSFITNICQEKRFSKEKLYLMYDYILTKVEESKLQMIKNKIQEEGNRGNEHADEKETLGTMLDKSIFIKCCLECSVLEPDYRDIIVSIQKNKSLQKGDQGKRFTVAEDMDDEDEAMFHQLVDLWETNKGDIEEYVFKLVPADNEIEQKDMMKDKYNELVELLEARLNGRKALELYTELLQGI